MAFESFAEGPLLWMVFTVFLLSLVARVLFFFAAVIRSSRDKNTKIGYDLATLGRFLAPFHMAVGRKPLYAVLRYIFHFCLVVVPVWLVGHIVLWSESRLGWDWISLPDAWADRMTLIFLVLAAYFFGRRIFSKNVRPNSFLRDYLIIFFTALPFLTGYFLAHGSVDQVGFLGTRIRTIHVLSGEAMILMAAFLFCRTWLNTRKCTGCAACELACPTGTLESRDEERYRLFHYSHYQCISCASCVNVCPEEAAELRHQFSIPLFFKIGGKYEIRKAELEECERCGAFFAPEPQMDKVKGLFPEKDYLLFCPDCRRMNAGDVLHALSPWHRKSGERDKSERSVHKHN